MFNKLFLENLTGRKAGDGPDIPLVIAVTSGKGGVGKSVLSVNLALLLKQMHKKVLLIDADVYLGSVDVMLGMRSEYNLGHVVANQASLEQVIQQSPHGIDILPACGGIQELLALEDQFLQRLAKSFAAFEGDYDVVLLDTGAGIASEVLSFVLGADITLLTVTPDPAALTDAYAMLKMIRYHQREQPVALVCNQVASREEGDTIFHKMNLMAHKFLHSHISNAGSILREEEIGYSVKRQSPYVIKHPNSPFTRSLRHVRTVLMHCAESRVKQESFLFERLARNRALCNEVLP